MDTIEVTFELPTRARARAKSTGKWHEGAVTLPLTVRLPVVDAEIATGMVWGKQRFAGDGEALHCLVDTDDDPADPSDPSSQFHPTRAGVTKTGVSGLVVDGTVTDEVRRAVEVVVDPGELGRFNRMAHVGWVSQTVAGAAEVRDKFALKHPMGDLEVTPLDEVAVRPVLEGALGVDRRGALVCRVPPPEAVITRAFEILPSTALPDHTDELFRVPLGPDGLGSMGDRIVELTGVAGYVPTSISFPTSPVPEAADHDGRLGRRPDAEARMRMVHAFGTGLTKFPDEARDLLTPLRPDLEGDDPEAGTAALRRLFERWCPHVKYPDNTKIAIVLAGLERLDAALDRRRTMDVVYDALDTLPVGGPVLP